MLEIGDGCPDKAVTVLSTTWRREELLLLRVLLSIIFVKNPAHNSEDAVKFVNYADFVAHRTKNTVIQISIKERKGGKMESSVL